ncbi:LysR substrate-binding domain-containing protein [Caulobacter sp. UC70_42]|uniref:LysR substrate-binding domain-containing protein n=1 Tax=Caulobacter sp. UC70_42 TaxID=3374551 RepID=UPI0037575189
MMRLGLGLAWVPAWIGLAPLRDGLVVELLREWRAEETAIHAIRLERRHTPSRVRSVLDGLQAAATEWRYLG